MAALFAASGLVLALSVAGCGDRGAGRDWTAYGGEGGDRYSPLKQITKANVGQLVEAWKFEAGPGGLQTSPLVIDGVLYAVTAAQEVIALDAATGELRWRRAMPDAGRQPIRGLSYW